MNILATKPENPQPGDTWLEHADFGMGRIMVMTQSGPVPAMPPTARDAYVPSEATHSHVHRDDNGFLHRCYHKCRSLFTWQFFLGLTLSFPIEHALWTKVTPFVQIADWLGLGINHHH